MLAVAAQAFANFINSEPICVSKVNMSSSLWGVKNLQVAGTDDIPSLVWKQRAEEVSQVLSLNLYSFSWKHRNPLLSNII